MPARKPPDAGTDAFFADLDPESRTTALALRDLVRRAAPNLRETLKMGVPHWVGNGWVCYIAIYTRHVNLGFYHGAEIRDTAGLLEGTGKGMRHVKVAKGAAIPRRALATLVQKAAALDGRSAVPH